jgi:simple sugar transport system permease protein
VKVTLDIRSLFAAPLRSGLGRRLGALLFSFILAGIVIVFTGHNVGEAFSALWSGSTGLEYGPPLTFDKFTASRIVAEATPLLLCGLAVAACLKAGLFNIGAAGQMTLGAFVTAWTGLYIQQWHAGPFIQSVVALGAGCLAGALCGAFVGWLKAYRNIHEVISTIMLNYVLADITQYLITNHFRDPSSMDVQTRKLSESLWFPQLVVGTNLTSGVFIAIVALIAYVIILQYTAFGFRVRALGAGPAAARASGIPITRTTIQVMALGGLLAGAAGAIQVLGIYHRDLADVSGAYGFQGIAVALLAAAEGPGMLFSSLFFGGLNNGATVMQLDAGVPSSLISIVQATIIVASAMRIVRRTNVQLRRRVESEAQA